MNHREIAGLMAAIAPTIGDFVGKAMAPLRAENERLSSSLAAVEQRFADFSAARENDRVVFLTLVKEEIAKVELPVKEIDPVEIERVVNEKVEKAVSALPVPTNGRDADPVDLDEVASRAAKLLPVPENGKDADPEAIKAAVLDVVAEVLPGEVSAAVDKIENPKDGKDADPVDPVVVANLLVDLMPVPKDGKDGVDGKSVTIEEIAPLIDGAVALEFAKVIIPEGTQGPQGAAGKSITVEDVKPLLQEMVSALPKAENGKDADPVEVAALIIEDVVKLIPIPTDGKDVTVEDVLPVIQEMIEQKFSEIPKPKDGIDGADVVDLLIDHAGMLVATLSNGKTKTLGPIVGKDAEIEPLERMIEEKLGSLPVPELDKATVAKFVEQELDRISKDFRKSDDFVPDDVASNVALVVKMMAETPQTQHRQEMQPINVYSDVTLPEMKFPETVVNVSMPEQQAPVVNMAAPIVNVEPAKVEIPKRGKEVTTVTGWDKSGRIKTFEKREVDEE